jgi:Flp pilus assembly protein TadD
MPQIRPQGEVYDWYQRGLALLGRGDAAAAAQLLEHAAAAEPESRSVREALGRAQFDAGRYAEARSTFAAILEQNPVEDYAAFGCGLAMVKQGDFRGAVKHLALAVALRPALRHSGAALRRARAGLAAQ